MEQYQAPTIKISNPIRFLVSALIVFFGLASVSVRADDLPKFSDPKVSTFVSQYAQFVTQAYEQVVKNKDPSQLAQLKSQVDQLQKGVADVAKGLQSKPKEAERFEEFIASPVSLFRVLALE